MRIQPLTGLGRVGRGAPVLAAALALTALAGSGATAAVARPGDGGAPRDGSAAGVISTVAGGVGGPARATGVALVPCGVAYGAGRLYIASGGAARAVNPRTDWLTTPAGTGVPGPLGDGGPATKASLDTCGTAVDHAGNLVIADLQNNRIRVVAAHTGTYYGRRMTAGHIYTVAGDGTEGFAGDGGPARQAELADPLGIAVDAAGNLLVADVDNARIRLVAARTGSFYGQAMTAGDIYTVAGDGTEGFSGDGGPATSAELNDPFGVAVDAAGNLLIADQYNNRIRVVAAHTGTYYGQAMTAGHIYTIAGDGTEGSAGNGGPATRAELGNPEGVAVDAAGNVLIADQLTGRVQAVAAHTGTYYGRAMTAGHIYTIAAGLNGPDGVAVDAAGDVLIAELFRVQAVAASTGTHYGMRMTAGHIYTVAGNGTQAYSGDGGLATRAELFEPTGVAADAAGNVVIADQLTDRVRVAAARSGTFYGVAMRAGHIYTVAGDGQFGFSGNGGPARQAELDFPQGVAVDTAGNLVIADQQNNRVRVVAARTGTFYGQSMTAGHIYTVAGNGTEGFSGDGGPATSAELSLPWGVAVGATGNLVIGDQQNNRVRVVAARSGTFYGQSMTAGHIYTVAGDGNYGFSGDGGPATNAELNLPQGVAVDAAGNLVIADTSNNRVRVVAARSGTFYDQSMTAGHIYTVAGGGTSGLGDGGLATSAELALPVDVAVDAAGNLVITDSDHARVRVVAARTGTFYGQSMTAGDIYTVAGGGTNGLGDGGPATSAELTQVQGVAVNAAGNLLIADFGNARIRMVTG